MLFVPFKSHFWFKNYCKFDFSGICHKTTTTKKTKKTKKMSYHDFFFFFVLFFTHLFLIILMLKFHNSWKVYSRNFKILSTFSKIHVLYKFDLMREIICIIFKLGVSRLKRAFSRNVFFDLAVTAIIFDFHSCYRSQIWTECTLFFVWRCVHCIIIINAHDRVYIICLDI